MLQALAYPFDSPELLRHRKQYRRQLLEDGSQRLLESGEVSLRSEHFTG